MACWDQAITCTNVDLSSKLFCGSHSRAIRTINNAPHEKINGHCELTVTTVVTALGPNDYGSVTARTLRRGHSSVTARSQWGHSSITARSQLAVSIFSMITARSQLNYGPGQGSVTAGCDHFGHQWADGEQSRWQIFFSWVTISGDQIWNYSFGLKFVYKWACKPKEFCENFNKKVSQLHKELDFDWHINK